MTLPTAAGSATLALGLVLVGCGSESAATGSTGVGATSGAESSGSAGILGGTAGAAGSAGLGGDRGGGRGGRAASASAGAVGASLDGRLFTVSAELASDIDSAAPGTVAIVRWSIDSVEPESATIEFGLDRNYEFCAPVDLTDPEYRTLLLGMKPSRSYHFRVVVTAADRVYASDDRVIDTGPPSPAVPVGDFTVLDAAAYERGFIVASYWYGAGSHVAFILDADGELVWWYASGFDRIARARMSEDGDSLWLVSASNFGEPLERVSLDTLEAQTYPDTCGSHDITPVVGATMAYLEYGANEADSIFTIDSTGTVAEVFDPSEFLDGAGHANALRYSRREDVYVMTDVTQDIFVVNRDGTLRWRVSEILPEGIASLGGSQHGQHLLDDSIVILANEWDSELASAAVEYDLSGRLVWLYEGDEYTSNLGDVQRLPGGNTMVTYSNASIVRQVTPTGEVVMQWEAAESRMGYTLWRESLYGPPPDILQ